MPAIFLFALLLQIGITPVEAAEPFQGEVNADNINVRTDATVNSAIICTVNKNEAVEVITELYDWYKIRLPQKAPAYIKQDLVACIDAAPLAETECKNAKVLKDRVNIRLGPSESAAIIGAANKNDTVNIIEGKGGWYKIEPLQTSFGWINKRFITKVVPPAPAPKNDIPVPPPEPPDTITLSGVIKPYGKVIKRIATHKLITQDNRIFLLKGDKKSLDALNYQKVKVVGKILDLPRQKYPVIEIRALEEAN